MSGLTPSRIRTKTSEITDFFRSSSSHTAGQSRSSQNDLSTQSQASAYTLDVPSSSSPEGLTKKKSTRIPFLGRTRKKSNQSATASPFAITSLRDSSDVGEQSSRTASTDRNPTVEIFEPQPPARVTMVSPSPVKASSPSLGSKLAAHFQSSRTRKLSALGSKPPLESTSHPAGSSSNYLLTPDANKARGTSLDSGSSGARSPTPRPAQPTITVSLSPDNLDEYKDLFTMPRHRKPARQPSSDSGTPRQNTSPDSDVTPNSSPSSSPRVASPINQDLPRRGSAPTIIDISRQKVSKSQGDVRKPTKPSYSSSTEKNGVKQDDTSTPRDSDGKDSTRSSLSDKLPTGSISRRVSSVPSTPASDYSAQQRLRMRQQSSASEKRNRPPSMPPPMPPPTPPPQTNLPPSTPRTSTSSNTAPAARSSTRRRANTIGSISSVSNSPLSQSTVPGDSQKEEEDQATDVPIPNVEAPVVDLNSATRDQLQDALINRNLQLEELASYLQKITEKHLVEKAALEKKVSHLEREMSKKEHQIKGLMWLVANNKSPPATDFPSNLSLPPLSTTKAESEQEPPKIASRMPIRRMQLSDDSGAESHPTSGAESIRTSETSGNESSSLRHRRVRRPFVLGESSFKLYQAATGKRLPPKTLAPDGALPEVPYLSASKRSSISSASLSPSSSTSSLLPPSPSLTVSSLSAIPESPPASAASFPKVDSYEQQDERRAVRAAHRVSASSMASSSTAASSAYASNLKRSRPPSIAQVLENSPHMDDVLEKLRPFQPQP